MKFAEAWQLIAKQTGLNSESSTTCRRWIQSFWIRRPHWFIPARSELVNMRLCLDIARTLINTARDNEELADSVSIIMSASADIMNAVYAPRTEIVLRRNQSLVTVIRNLEDRLSEYSSFQDFYITHPNIRQMLQDATATVDHAGIVMSNYEDVLMAYKVMEGGTELDLVHAGDFVDHIWARAAIAGNGAISLPFWKSLAERVSDFDAKELIYESEKPQVIQNINAVFMGRMTHYHRGMGLGRSAWLSTVGRTLRSLTPHTAIQACLTQASDSAPGDSTWDILESHPLRTIDFYSCVVNGVESGNITVPDNGERGNHIATLMHLVRMSHSALPFLLKALGESV
jgi:hypothetical protein